MSRNRFPLFMILAIMAIVMDSCDSKRFYEVNQPIAKGVWNSANRIRFDVPVTDTLSFFNFFINVRNTTDYPYSNLYLFIHTTNPAGTKAEDTVDCPLADYSGKWLGSGFGTIKFNRFLVQPHVRFSKKGHYIFEVEQAMRGKVLKGIPDIGIRIEKEQVRNAAQ